MKSLNILLVILISVLLMSCKKSEDPPKDDSINYYEINKTITTQGSDSILIAYSHLIFKIISDTSYENTVLMSSSCQMDLCDVFDFIVNDSNNNMVLPLDVDLRISDYSNWNVKPRDICLDEFAGVGDKYIGFRHLTYGRQLPPGRVSYSYGWIKINLSFDKKELKIISRAINYTKDNYIQAGETE